ncbi:MAG: hypothetical protein HYV61_08075 [Candidatus Rokubacteria bacterium]|nr:hypothetical protein [Candidatus Rokubacteria bacterium]
MGGLRLAGLWVFAWSMLFLSLALVLCSYTAPAVRPFMCHNLQGFVVEVSESVEKLFGG